MKSTAHSLGHHDANQSTLGPNHTSYSTTILLRASKTFNCAACWLLQQQRCVLAPAAAAMDRPVLPDNAPPTQLELLSPRASLAWVWHHAREALLVFRASVALCRGNSCSCLGLQACLQRLMERAAEVQPQLGTLVDLKVHMCLPTYYSYIPDCPHAAATRLAIAEAYYK